VASAAAASALLVTALTVPTSASADEGLTPIVFVHGGAGSGAQYESQARRFDSNGYPDELIFAYEYDSSFSVNSFAEVIAGLDSLVDDVRAEFGVEQVYLVGHSLGTFVSGQYLADPERQAKIGKYIGVDGGSSPACGVGDPDLDCMGIWQGTNTTGDVGGNNVRLSPQTHVQAATSAESFAAQYEFFTGQPPETTLILPEPPGQVEISGRAVEFPLNIGTPGAVLQIWAINGDTGHRISQQPADEIALADDGSFGPVKLHGNKHYEFVVHRDGFPPHHFYFEPFFRSTDLVRMNMAPPGSSIVSNSNLSENHTAAVIVRQKEWWTTHSSGMNDILEISTTSASRGDHDAGNVFTNITSNGVIGVHVHDAAATPGDSTLDLLPFFPTQPFQSGVDVFMPAADPADGTVSFVSTPRGDTDHVQTISVPNWPSDTDRVTVTFNDFVQDIDDWGECKRAIPSPCLATG
jgi:hypothetical protein